MKLWESTDVDAPVTDFSTDELVTRFWQTTELARLWEQGIAVDTLVSSFLADLGAWDPRDDEQRADFEDLCHAVSEARPT